VNTAQNAAMKWIKWIEGEQEKISVVEQNTEEEEGLIFVR
jgi:hypothetical protein